MSEHRHIFIYSDLIETAFPTFLLNIISTVLRHSMILESCYQRYWKVLIVVLKYRAFQDRDNQYDMIAVFNKQRYWSVRGNSIKILFFLHRADNTYFPTYALLFSCDQIKEIRSLSSSRDASWSSFQRLRTYLFATTVSLLESYFIVPLSLTHPDPDNRAMLSRVSRSNFYRPSIRIYRGHPFVLQVSIRQPVHGGQWPLIWRRKTTSRGYKERQDSQGFRPVPRASCHPIPPLYLIPRPSRPTSPVSVSNNDRQCCMVRRSRNVRLRTLNPRSPSLFEITMSLEIAGRYIFNRFLFLMLNLTTRDTIFTSRFLFTSILIFLKFVQVTSAWLSSVS